jgi:hypothetical protein
MLLALRVAGERDHAEVSKLGWKRGHRDRLDHLLLLFGNCSAMQTLVIAAIRKIWYRVSVVRVMSRPREAPATRRGSALLALRTIRKFDDDVFK